MSCIESTIHDMPDNSVPRCSVPLPENKAQFAADISSRLTTEEREKYGEIIQKMMLYEERNCSKLFKLFCCCGYYTFV